MTLSLGMLTMDTTDARSLAQWWAEQTGSEIAHDFDGWFVAVRGGSLPVTLGFQKVEDPTAGKNKLHLDLTADDRDAEVDRLVSAGASLVGTFGDENFSWVTLADPDGNLFDVAAAESASAADF